MSGQADVKSIEAIRGFRPAWIVFREECMAAVTSAVSSAVRTLDWVQKTQAAHWKHEIRKRSDEATRCKLELERKKLSASGDPRSAVEERKAYERARRRLDVARERAEAVRYWSRQLQREVDQLRGDVQPLQTFLASDVPRVMAALERMSGLLDEYVAIQVPDGGPGSPGGSGVDGAGDGSGSGAVSVLGAAGGRAEGGGRGAGRDVAALRARVPGREVRLGAEAGRVKPKPLHMSLLARNEVVIGLPGERDVPGDAETLTVSSGWDTGSRAVMVRVGRASAGDSGWHVMALREDEDAGACKAVSVGAFLKARPEHRAVVALEMGSVVVLEGGEVVEVYDRSDAALFLRDDAEGGEA